MKFGMRRPSFKKSLSARTSAKKIVKNAVGLKMPRGWGWLTSPKKYTYNKIYNKTSFSIFDLLKKLFK